MGKEKFKYLFVENLPILVEERRLTKQLLVEMIFSGNIGETLSLDIQTINERKEKLDYVV